MGYFGGSTILALGVQGLGLGDGFECRVSGFGVYLLAPLKGFLEVCTRVFYNSLAGPSPKFFSPQNP